MFQTIPQNVAAKEAIRDKLEKSGFDTVAYSQLSELAKGDIQTKKRYILDGALKLLLDKGMVYSCVRSIGIRRLQNNEIGSVGKTCIVRIRSLCKRTARKLDKVDESTLSNPEKIERSTAASVIGAIGLMVKQQHIKRLEAVVTVNQQVISPGRIHALFANGSGENKELK